MITRDDIRKHVLTFGDATFTTADVAACRRWPSGVVASVIKNLRRQGLVEPVGEGDNPGSLRYVNVGKPVTRGWEFAPLLACFGGRP